jgi:hypothetical protein
MVLICSGVQGHEGLLLWSEVCERHDIELPYRAADLELIGLAA